MQHKFLIWLARYSDKRSDNLDYLALLLHFNVRSIKSRFVQYDPDLCSTQLFLDSNQIGNFES